MATVTASATSTVPAPPEQVTSFLADLSNRPKILTPNYTAVSVEDGNVLAFHFTAAKRERDYRLTSVLNGSALTETDAESSFINTWQVIPDPAGSLVTLTATWNGAGGIGGFFEGRFAPIGLGKIYTEILTNLAGSFA